MIGSILARCATVFAVAFIGGVLLAGDVDARASGSSRSSSSSGGYSRPSTSAPVRRPSISTPSPSRTPPSSGGYSRPSSPSPGAQWAPVQRTPSVTRPAQGAGDRDVQRRTSVDALAQYRQQQERLRQEQQRFQRPSPTIAPPPPSAPGPWRTAPRYDRYDDWSRARTTYYGGYGWSPPAYSYRSAPSFGMWDAMMLWFLLDNLRRPGSADFFHHHRDDPGIQAWRADTERLGRDDTEVRRKLDDLDAELARRQDQPRDPSYLPPDLPPGVALAAEQAVRPPAQDSGGGGTWLIVLVLAGGGALFGWLWWRRRQAAAAPHAAAAHPEAGDMTKFRVGMTLSIDPTPFLLGGEKLRLKQPQASAAGLLSVEAVGTLDGHGMTLRRLYLPGGDAFFQLHLDRSGAVDEARYFAKFDEVAPATPEEWGFWLDQREGMIGWPEFDTKDGQRHSRLWSPEGGRVAPVRFAETIKAVDGTWTRNHDAMLYARSTELADPAPQAEYLLVAAVEGEAGARVELHLGIDINPAGLSLT